MPLAKYGVVLWLCLIIGVSIKCADDRLEDSNPSLQFYQPSHFPQAEYLFSNNPQTAGITEIGRRLFFDPILSRDSTISCENCHVPVSGFADPSHAFSHGIDQQFGSRNSPALSNLAWYSSFMWDGGIAHIETMPSAPITNPIEMDLALREAVLRLNRSTYYKSAFARHFGVDEIESQHMLKAMAQFMASLISDQSPYDAFLKGDKSVLNEEEKKGLNLFQTHCNQCHSGALTTDFSFKNNGLSDSVEDEGRGHITTLTVDLGKFKVPSLRNIEKTLPYMHNASLQTLEEVVEHYSSGIQAHPNLDPSLPIGGFQFSDDNKEALVAFLKSLTDEAYLQDHRLRNPW